MTEEEKKAIEDLKVLVSWREQKPEIRDYELEAINTILNLTEKQQKENEELKEINKQQFLNYEAKIDKMEYEMGYDYISKDKIKNIIESSYPDFAIQKIKELLEE